MPFELGLAIVRGRGKRHEWFVFEADPHRLKKSLSDLDGTDPHIHDGNPKGVLRALSNALLRRGKGPTFAELYSIYADLKRAAKQVKRERGGSLFEAGAFKELRVLARELAGGRIAYLKK